MRPTNKTLVLTLTLALLGTSLCACERHGDTPGQQLDRALDKTGDKVIEAGEAIKTK